MTYGGIGLGPPEEHSGGGMFITREVTLECVVSQAYESVSDRITKS